MNYQCFLLCQKSAYAARISLRRGLIINRVNVNNNQKNNGCIDMKTIKNRLNEKEIEFVKFLMSDCKNKGDIQNKLKRLFTRTIEKMFEAEIEEHLRYEKIL